jgi:hypothetical protein
VTIEDLLKLKRLERPPGEFWTQFERELRAKQLAAIVENRPWWHRLSRGAVFLSRQHIPIGAVAVLALTWVSVRQFDPTQARSAANARFGEGLETASATGSAFAPIRARSSAAASPSGLARATGVVLAETDRAAVAETGTEVSQMRPLSLPREEAEAEFGAEAPYASPDAVASAPAMGSLVPVADSHLAPAPAAAIAVLAAEPARATPTSWSSSTSSSSSWSSSASASLASAASSSAAGSGSDELFSPAARLIASNLSAVRDADPDSAHRFLVANQGFAATAVEATAGRRLVDPMARMNPISEERRSRLLSSALPDAGSAEVISTAMSERTESRLSSDRLYDSISRYGVDGHSISIKF